MNYPANTHYISIDYPGINAVQPVHSNNGEDSTIRAAIIALIFRLGLKTLTAKMNRPG